MTMTAMMHLCRTAALAAAIAVPLSLGIHDEARAAEIRVDCSRPAGVVRPLHGINNGPLNCGETVDLSAFFREFRPPLTRLHDSEWPNPDVVDIHAVFPDPAADPERPESYRFARTDDYIRAIVQTGTGIVYRLGESIEHSRRKYHVAPPADSGKWAAACLGIIRHYNEGWADGFRYQIRYWEIWNEPENRPAMWTGSDEDYYRLYATAAKAIKARYPALRVGGPSVGATGDVVDGRLRPTPFLEGFLKHCRETGAPLDFFSWHTYTDDPWTYVRKAHAVRRWLDENGFKQAEVHLNEWNYLPDNDWVPMLVAGQGLKRQQWYARMGGAEGAAFTACVLALLQDAPVDVVNYYTGDSSPFGLFTRDAIPKKTFYTMKAFRMLLDTPQRVEAGGIEAGRGAVCAGIDAQGGRATVFVSHFRGADKAFDLVVERLPWDGPTAWTVFRLDASRDLEAESGQAAGTPVRIPLALEAPAVAIVRLIKVSAAGPAKSAD